MSGETPNLAARLQALAEPGTVVISQATRRLLGGVFDLHDLGPLRLKGFAEPLAAFRVEGEGRAEGRFEARQTAGLTPLVGREEEIALLLRRWGQARDGEGQVVLLSGEPGIGKSRLVREVRDRLAEEPHIRLLYQCSPHHTTSPLHPVIEQLERAAGFERDDPPEARLDKLEALLTRGTDRLDEAVPLIAALLGMPTGGSLPAARADPAAPEAADAGGAGRPARRPRGRAAGAPGLRGRALDRSDHAGAARARDRARPAPAGARAHHLPAGVQPRPGRASRTSARWRSPGSAAARARRMVERVVGAKALPAEVPRRSSPRPTACPCSSRS